MIEENLSFFSEGLRLEGRLAYGDGAGAADAKVLLCPPHPFLGGDMENNVLSALTKTLIRHELVVFRFNYRGIGQSETDRDLEQDQRAFWEDSTCPEYESKIFRDSQVALQTLVEVISTDKPVYIIGYSFGCLPAIQLASKNPVSRLGLISPPLTKWQFSADQFQPGTLKKLFYSTDDFACPTAAIEQLYSDMPAPCEIHAFKDADHFFIGQEKMLANSVANFLAMEDRVTA